MKVKLLLALCFAALSAAATRADPLVITGGSVQVLDPQGLYTFGMSGDGFAVGGSSLGAPPSLNCAPCPSGTITQANFLIAAPESMNFSIGGASYSTLDPFRSPGAYLTITTPTFVVAQTVIVPFTLTGSVFASDNGTIFSYDLAGQGFVTLDYYVSPDGRGGTLFDFKHATYTFTSAPEPATLLLFGTGLAALASAARRRRA